MKRDHSAGIPSVLAKHLVETMGTRVTIGHGVATRSALVAIDSAWTIRRIIEGCLR